MPGYEFQLKDCGLFFSYAADLSDLDYLFDNCQCFTYRIFNICELHQTDRINWNWECLAAMKSVILVELKFGETEEDM